MLSWLLLLTGFLALYIPTFIDLFKTLWSTDQNAHGPIVLLVSIWFFYFKTNVIAQSDDIKVSASPVVGGIAFAVGLLFYVAGRSQSIYLLEVGSIVPVLLGAVLTFFGGSVAKRLWFAFFFMCFMIPLPGSVVDQITQPMKVAVSYGTEHILYWLGTRLRAMAWCFWWASINSWWQTRAPGSIHFLRWRHLACCT